MKEIIEILEELKIKINSISVSPENTVIDDTDLCQKLKISKRTSSYWRSMKYIKFSKIQGKIFYKWSDVLNMVEAFRVE